MNKKLIIGLTIGAGAAACVAAARQCQQCPTPNMWAKMREKMDEMPADFPPRMMFDNVEATRANTEEILALLRQDTPTATEATAAVG